ncbi:hypothetical protein HGP28_02305 [Vibrio sp. SM6]|uniref:Uncharacterized protein n=1 Tax=Vibrio agarilyticus TaxID=2726741 RepID=A0A7X8TMZ4_9VIBR|nr:hypothetical protein [Vibrio agarilyticus]NLS11720.1 hypothetical protein [Vibrio agarilyticus]
MKLKTEHFRRFGNVLGALGIVSLVVNAFICFHIAKMRDYGAAEIIDTIGSYGIIEPVAYAVFSVLPALIFNYMCGFGAKLITKGTK